MAGFGGLGGLGGSSYPQRYGAPASNQIKTDQELTIDHNAWADPLERQLANIRAGDAGTVLAQQAYNANDAGRPDGMSLDYWKDAANRAQGGSGLASYAGPQEGNLTGWFGGINDLQLQMDADTEAQRAAIANQLAQGNAAFDTNMQQRGENRIRQQQSYDSMNGWNQLNGVMGANYTDPNFGQISGQASGPLTAPNMPDGVDPSWTSGVFDPSGGLTGVYGVNTSTKKQGFL